jgi:hypothetical protein
MINRNALKITIENDDIAYTLMLDGDDAACAKRCSEIMPKVPKELKLSELGILALYQHNPVMGVTVVHKIKQAQQTSLFAAIIVPFMAPGNSVDTLPDFSLELVREYLITPVQDSGVGLTEEEARPIFEAGVTPQIITQADIEYVRTRM